MTYTLLLAQTQAGCGTHCRQGLRRMQLRMRDLARAQRGSPLHRRQRRARLPRRADKLHQDPQAVLGCTAHRALSGHRLGLMPWVCSRVLASSARASRLSCVFHTPLSTPCNRSGHTLAQVKLLLHD